MRPPVEPQLVSVSTDARAVRPYRQSSIKRFKMKKTKYLIVAALAVSLSSCNIYKKYELPTENSYVKTYEESLTAAADSASLPFLSWEQVFTDPVLQGYIRTALENNKDLDNAVKNIDIANAQLKGAKLSYFPAVALNPNGGAAKYGSGKMDTWTYTIPLSISWEIDVFGKILNRKRGAKVAVEQMEDYYQAVHSQIICGVASCYYSLMLLNQQLDLTERTTVIWKDQVESMKLMKEAGWVNEAAVVQSTANYWSIMGTDSRHQGADPSASEHHVASASFLSQGVDRSVRHELRASGINQGWRADDIPRRPS